MRNRENENENFVIQYDGNFYRIQNEFGNISFEFDVSSGYAFVQELNGIINSDIENEINSFLNEQDLDNDNDNRQVDMFNNINKYAKKPNKSKSGLNITFNKSSKINTEG